MFTRTTGLLIIPSWLAAMSWLVVHDVLPGWTAQEPPVVRASEWLRNEGSRAQFAIFDDQGRLGTAWTRYIIDEGSIQRQDFVGIDRLIPGIAPLRMVIDSVFTAHGALDEFTLRLKNESATVSLHGERFHSAFSFTFESGGISSAFKIPLTDGEVLAAAFNPLAQLSELRVGQSWRMQVFNPVAALTGFGKRFIPMLVTVTGEERIATVGGTINCMVVEAANAKAWVDARGAVQVQEMTLPLLGKIRIVREPEFDEEARKKMRYRSFHGSGGNRP